MDKQEPGYFEKTEKLVKEYLNNRLLLLKLQATEKTARIISFMAIAIILMMLGFFIVLFVCIMGGYYFAEVTGSLFYGFGIVTAFYLVLLLVVMLLRKRILDPFITNTVVRIFFD